ncbi:hypothetical protein [Allomuricauda sp. F6463D]|uniref:hypothetical protein n=1 Tax=Allomuricauda sp. F6463D TaxID=2926409 RepID=UPI001FF67992|nr:hypothetical protein [Muricauda sp. F6463D]MCK0159566.1 hypothetical protein [Muricauda sp. F6463D]
MKKIAAITLHICTILLLISCSEDNDDDNGFSSAELVGTWDLVEVNVNTGIDLDGDGSTSSNLLDEENCISGTLVLNDDSTYQFEESNFSLTSITNGLYVVQCTGSTLATGAWASNGMEVVFQGSTVLGTLQLNNNKIVKTTGDDLPGVASYVYERR